MSRENTISSLQSFMAGYVDTVGYVALFGVFTSHVTGNFVLLGAELAKPGSGTLIKLLAFPAFIVSVAVSTLLVRWAERRERSGERFLLAMQALLMIAFMLAGMAAEPLVNPDAGRALAAGMLGAAAMGVQNAAARLLYAKLSPSTVMTGNVTQLVIECMKGLAGPVEGVGERVRKLLWPVIAFAVGAVSGALGFLNLGFFVLLLPVFLLVGMLVWSFKRSSLLA
ncbi:MAG TPA: YoaK family protein [Burkholderiaceae bacterium]|jgi:uncharacterized membrane protein YoaK (UPF0700 family)